MQYSNECSLLLNSPLVFLLLNTLEVANDTELPIAFRRENEQLFYDPINIKDGVLLKGLPRKSSALKQSLSFLCFWLFSVVSSLSFCLPLFSLFPTLSLLLLLLLFISLSIVPVPSSLCPFMPHCQPIARNGRMNGDILNPSACRINVNKPTKNLNAIDKTSRLKNLSTTRSIPNGRVTIGINTQVILINVDRFIQHHESPFSTSFTPKRKFKQYASE